MTHTTIASAADYADALITARRAKGMLFILLLLFLLVQITVFFLAAYTDLIFPPERAADTTAAVDPDAATPPTTAPAVGDDRTPMLTSLEQTRLANVLQYLTGLISFLGIALSIVLSLTLLLLLLILLSGRLMGVSQLTSSWIWSVILVVLLFPWQAFLVSPLTASPQVDSVEHTALQREDFKVPGVLYTWSELTRHSRFMHQDLPLAEVVLKWARFVAFPVIALIILLMIQVRSNRGLRRELGDAVDTEPGEPYHA
jgi:hypothetical protein